MSVLIATPCYGGVLTVGLFQSLMGILEVCAQRGIEANVLTVVGESAITRGRSNLAATFLRYEYRTLAMIDADITIDPEDFVRLLGLDKPVRGAAVALKTHDHSESLSVFRGGRIKRADMPSEPFEVDYIGGAVMLIDREVIETLSGIEELKYVDPANGRGTHIFAERIVDGALLSEDYAFCHLAREHGFSVWCDPSVRVSHAGVCSWSA